MNQMVSNWIQMYGWWEICTLAVHAYERIPAVRKREAARRKAERERIERITRAYVNGEKWWEA
jgi:hypothetical protein